MHWGPAKPQFSAFFFGKFNALKVHLRNNFRQNVYVCPVAHRRVTVCPQIWRSATGTQHCEAGTPLLCLPSIVCGLPNPFLPIVLESHGTIIRLHFELRQFMDRIQNDGWITDIFAVARELLKLWELDQT